MLFKGVKLSVKGGRFQGRKLELQPRKGRSTCSKAAGVEVRGRETTREEQIRERCSSKNPEHLVTLNMKHEDEGSGG